MISNFIEKWGVDNPSKDDNIKKIKLERTLVIKDPLLAKQYSLPEGSYNTKCTLKSVWSDDEVIVDPELIKNSSDLLKALFVKNICTQIEEEFK